MQKCEKCNASFSWSKIFKSYKWTYQPIECYQCCTVHKITFRGRCFAVALTMGPFWFFNWIFAPFENPLFTLAGAILLAMAGFLLLPFVAQYEIDEKKD